MTKTRKRFTPEFKAKVAFEAIKFDKTINVPAQEFELQSNNDMEEGII